MDLPPAPDAFRSCSELVQRIHVDGKGADHGSRTSRTGLVCRLWIARLVAVACILAGCSASQFPGVPPAASPPHRPNLGGTLVVAWQEPDTLDPLYAGGLQAAATIYAVAVEGLVRPLPDGGIGPALAREVPTLANGLVTFDGTAMHVRYRLRPGIRWSDGAPLTSVDVRFTWQRIMSDPKVTTREGYDVIDGVEAPDDLTVDVTYRTLYPAYLTRFDAILPKHALESATQVSEYGARPLGTGPFRITEFARGDHVTAERNDRYREAGKPYLDRIVFRFVPSLTAAKAQLKAGEVQAAFNVSEADALELERESEIRLDSARSPIVEALSFNVERPVLADRAVRRALVLATPKELIVSKLLGGRARAGRNELPIGWAAPGELDQPAYDPERAKRTLEDAGWVEGSDAIRHNGGLRLAVEITSTTGNALREQVEQVLVDHWREIGVAATIRNVPSATLTAAYASHGIRKRGEFDVVLHQLGLGTIGGTDPQGYFAQRHRCDAIPRADNNGAGGNWERACDPRIDALLTNAGQTLDPAARGALYGDVLRIVNDEALDIWIFERARINAFRTIVTGYAGNAWDVPTWNVTEWRLAP